MANPDEMLMLVCETYRLSSKKILGKSRKKELVEARHTLMYLLRVTCKMSYPQIGKYCNRHHTTVMYAVKGIVKDVGLESDIHVHKDTDRQKSQGKSPLSDKPTPWPRSDVASKFVH